ncbi:BON domain-containing protein [Candidatus Dojkabacteria bacterium]|nr:BON domain-containing protein [Candidatus Dojkabacteria bacterium]
MANIRKDKDILFDVENQLVWDARVLSDNVDVKVEDGVVTLSGSVGTYTAKRAAEEDAWLTLGVIAVNSQLDVKYEKAELPADKDLEERILNKFLWDADLMSYKFEVDVNAGIATLKGTVDSYWKKEWAETLAERTYGVVMVKNAVTVVPTEQISDEVIAEEISESLARKLLKVELDKFDTKVKNGEVEFKGTVSNYAVWDAVMNTARYTAGVLKIDDDLIIERE